MIAKRWITCVAMNSSAAVHDVEIALFGRTSPEVVEENLADGSFGMARGTAEFLNGAAVRAARAGAGFGEGARRGSRGGACAARRGQLPGGAARRAGVPAKLVLRVALGAAGVDTTGCASAWRTAAAIGEASTSGTSARWPRGSRHAGAGCRARTSRSAPGDPPQVFLSKLTVARNLGRTVEDFAAVDFDMIRRNTDPSRTWFGVPPGGVPARSAKHEILIRCCTARLHRPSRAPRRAPDRPSPPILHPSAGATVDRLAALCYAVSHFSATSRSAGIRGPAEGSLSDLCYGVVPGVRPGAPPAYTRDSRKSTGVTERGQ